MIFLSLLIETDERSNRLGEIAFVSYDSRISNTEIFFYDALFDRKCDLSF
jgi:aminopeptidase